ncbi:MAG TPA: TonB-dependent receptor [Caulobacteraceae bacterium]|nr:TonB-dependent receptor [Caulobacteraceae bacterium]
MPNPKFRAGLLVGICGMALAAASVAYSQVPQEVTKPSDVAKPDASTANAEDSTTVGEVVVTGTHIRGIAPVGTNVVSMSQQDIIATGGTSANEILTKTPEVTSAFLQTPTTALNAGLAIVRPNIRNLGASGGSTTLVIVDGHRMVGAGVLQTTPDPDVIPPGVLQRVDIVPDGGSAIYGSDAIGGVINYISLKRFDGIELIARTGWAADYQTTDINATVGKDWGSGSGYVSYAWAHNNAIYGRDRDFVRQVTPNNGYCGAGTITANGTTYAISGPNPHTYTPGTISTCDITDPMTFWPKTDRHNVFASLEQELTSSVTLDLKGYYARRALTTNEGLDLRDLTVTSTNPFFVPIAGETSQAIRTNFANVVNQDHLSVLTSYGATPTITARLGGDWQLRAMANFGTSTTIQDNATIDATVAQNTINPYDLASNTPAAIAAIKLHNNAHARQSLENYRAIFDGPLFHLPGGDVRVALGAEYDNEQNHVQNGTAPYGAENTIARVNGNREVRSLFGEVAVPIFGEGNAASGIKSLTFSASGRYDDYSDVGSTFNPKLGLTYQPVDWIRVRGNWGTSFNAPSLVDKSGVEVAGGIFSFVFPFGQTAPWVIVLAGNTGSQMKPQTADTWSLGADIQPPSIPGLTLSATYYDIDLKKVIGLLAAQPFSSQLQPFYRDNVPCAQAASELAGVTVFSPLVSPALTCLFAPTTAILDWRVQNLGEIKTNGIDFNVSYEHPVSFGSVHASLAGTYTLNRDRAIVPGATFVETLDQPGDTRLVWIASAGAQIGDLNATASVNHRDGYDINPIVPARPGFPFPQAQDSISSFTTVDLYFDYKLSTAWLKDGAHLSLNVTNLFDKAPPFYSGGNNGYANGSTLGRLVQVGVRTKF